MPAASIAVAGPVDEVSVFISYSRADLDAVRPLAQALRRTGLRTWLDLDDLRPGQRWKEAIGNALRAADAMVFCVSGLSLASAWTSVELKRALALSLPVIPVAMEALDIAALPAPLRERQLCDMSRHPPRHAARLTAHEIATALGWPVATATTAPALDAAQRQVQGQEQNQGTAAARLLLALPAAPWPAALPPGQSPFAAGALAGNVVALPPGRDEALPALRAAQGPVEYLDLGRPERICLADIADWAGRAREAVLAVGPGADPAVVGLVLGTLRQAFGARRVLLAWCGPPPLPPGLASLAQIAGVLVVRG